MAVMLLGMRICIQSNDIERLNIEGTDARFVFRNNAKNVQFCIGDDYGDILNMCRTYTDPNENGCFQTLLT